MRMSLFVISMPLLLAGPVYGHSTEHHDHSHPHQHGQHHHHDHQHAADEHRQHGAHVHGAAHIDLIIADDEVMFSLLSPAMDIIGFEHAPTNADQQAQLDAALQKLEQPDHILKLLNGHCQLQTATVNNPFEARPDYDHVDIEAHYLFICDNAASINRIDVAVFEYFPAIESVNLQLVTDSSQQQHSLTSGQSRIRITE